MATLCPIPQPPTFPFLGNITLVDLEVPLRSFFHLAEQYGEIYQLVLSGGEIVIHANSAAIARQVSNDALYKKSFSRSLREGRLLAGDGLFTADSDEPNWGIAHRILMPAFSDVRSMFPEMRDICSQMLLKWERFGTQHTFDPSDDYTRLTFDTLALCSMSYRFNSFYERDMPDFTQRMSDFLTMSSRRGYRPAFAKLVPMYYKKEDQKYFEDAQHMTEVARKIIRQRKEQPTEKPDLLNLMLEGKDPKTSAQLTEENIIFNLLTFLIAGHETTSGLLTFTTYYLLKNPSCLQKLREELDEKLGAAEPTVDDLGKLPYLTAVLRESLRLWPTVPARSIVPKQDVELIGGDGDPSNPKNKRYAIKKGQTIFLHTVIVHRDPLIWGNDAEVFRPERMLDGKFDGLPKHSWQPFGYGGRSCIGRSFAIQEALLVLASTFNQFDLYLNDPSYTLEIKQNLSIKPKDMFICAVPRKRNIVRVPRPISPCGGPSQAVKAYNHDRWSGYPLFVLYGSNTGTSQAFAQRIASDAYFHGFDAHLDALDNTTGHLATNSPVIIVTSSFEGEPADNAVRFVSWLCSLQIENGKGPLHGVEYAIFGCGNHEWVHTYQRIPTLIDGRMADMGAKRLMERHEGDAASPDFMKKFDNFGERIWAVLEDKYHVGGRVNGIDRVASVNIEIRKLDGSRKELLRASDADPGRVLANRLLTKPGAPEKRHIDIQLPDGMSYRAGDYLVILPSNPEQTVQRAMHRYDLIAHQEVIIKANGLTSLPTDTPISIGSLLSGFVELSQPATTRDLVALREAASHQSTISVLSSLMENYQKDILERRISLLYLLERYPDINLPFGTFLNLLPPMKVRQYSISSSPLANPSSVSLTFGVIDGSSFGNNGRRDFKGVASTFLARCRKGEYITVAARPSGMQFSLPEDPLTPIVMFSAGSGIAPFRGFIEERACQKSTGLAVGRAILFFGCRDPEDDYLYMDSEMQEWIRNGVVDVRPAFSRKSEASEGCKYVQHRVWYDRNLITALNDVNAKFYVCGSRRVVNGIKEVYSHIIRDSHPDWSDKQVAAEWERMHKERFASDVFD